MRSSLALDGRDRRCFWAFAIAKAVQVRRRPVLVGPLTSSATTGEVRRDGLVFVDGELWRARTRPTARRSCRASTSRSRASSGLELDGASRRPEANRTLMTVALIVVAVVFVLVLFLLVGDQGRARVRARDRLPPRPAAARAEGAGPLPADPDRRPDGQGRPAHDHAQHPAAGSDHKGQRPGPGERRRLLPHRRAEGRDRADRELHGRDVADRADDAAIGARPAPARRAALGAREDQRDPPGDHRRGDRPVGDQGLDRRGEGRRDPDRACSARWRARRRPSASGARRSSTPRASTRPPNGSRTPRS